jgi:ATP-binding cassette subfamily F protein 3
MLREVCDEFWLVTAGGVKPFDGDLDDYQRWLLEISRAAARGLPAPPLPGMTAAISPAAATPAPASGAKATAPAAPAKAAAPADAGNRRDDRKQAAQARAQAANRTRPLRLEVQQIDGRLEKLGAERAELENALASGTLPGSEIAEHGRRLNHIAAETAMLEERWLELQTEIEALSAGG